MRSALSLTGRIGFIRRRPSGQTGFSGGQHRSSHWGAGSLNVPAPVTVRGAELCLATFLNPARVPLWANSPLPGQTPAQS